MRLGVRSPLEAVVRGQMLFIQTVHQLQIRTDAAH